MNNKLKRISNFIAVLCISFLCSQGYAESGLLSPYSRFGIGTLSSSVGVRSMGMGGLNIGTSGTGHLSALNPASILFGVDTLSVFFDIGVSVDMNRLTQEIAGKENINHSISGDLINAEFYFPIYKFWKMGVYLLPVSRVFYQSLSPSADLGPAIGEASLLYTGSGGISKLGWANAFGHKNFAFGVNLNYDFGTISRTRLLSFENDSLMPFAADSKVITSTKIRGFSADFGFMYFHTFENKHKLSLGLSYSMQAKWKANSEMEGYGFYSYEQVDTAFFYETEKGNIHIPNTYRIGLSYEKINEFLIGADFSYGEWSKYSQFGNSADYYQDNWTVVVGAELKRKPFSDQKYRKLAYRLGFRYGTIYIDHAGKGLNEYAINVGISVPIRRTRSLINVALEYGSYGSIAKGQIKNDYLKIGLSFSSIESWFIKRKYD